MEGGEDRRFRVRLEREPDPMTEPGAIEGADQALGILDEAATVVDEERRPVLAGELLGITAGDREPAIDDLEARADPPRPIGGVREGAAASRRAGSSRVGSARLSAGGQAGAASGCGCGCSSE